VSPVDWDDLPLDEDRPGVLEALRRRWRRIVERALPPPGPPRPPRGHEPRRAGWTRALGVSLAAFALWLVLDAPTLQHNAQVSPVGIRRTVSLDLLGPLARISRDLGLAHVVSFADGVIGRHGNRPGNGLVAAPPPPKSTVTTTTLPRVVPDRHPSAKDPLRVLMVGDSLGIDLGDVLVNDLTGTGVVQATLDGQVSTGLTRPDYFDWPDELSVDLARYTPQLIVVMLGANDAQDFPGPPDVPFGTPAWDAIYRSRVSDFMTEATSRGAQVIWVGMPPMQNPGLSAAMARIDGIVAQESRRHSGVDFVDSTTVLGTPTGQFTPYLVVGGQEVNVREPDGTHITPGGAQVLSTVVEQAIRAHLRVDLNG
jgi:lysophospholipase L1-like esterase